MQAFGKSPLCILYARNTATVNEIIEKDLLEMLLLTISPKFATLEIIQPATEMIEFSEKPETPIEKIFSHPRNAS